MALPSTGIRLRRCVFMLPMSMSFFTLARVSRDGAISAGWRATMGALLCVDRQVPGPPARNEGTIAPRRASSCPPAAVLAAQEEVRAAAPETAAEKDPLLLTAARLTAWSLAPSPAAPGAAAVVAAGVSVPSVRKEMGVRPAIAARMMASANSSSSSPSSSVAPSTTAAAAAAARASASSSPGPWPSSGVVGRAVLGEARWTAAPLSDLTNVPSRMSDALVGSYMLLRRSSPPKDLARLEPPALTSPSSNPPRGSLVAARRRRASWELRSSKAAPDSIALPDSTKR